MNIINNIDDFIKKHNITHLFIDIDGVIFASCDAIIQILNERYGGNFDGSDVTSWNFQCCYPNMTSEEIEDTFNDPKFFDIVKPIDGALKFVDRYRYKLLPFFSDNKVDNDIPLQAKRHKVLIPPNKCRDDKGERQDQSNRRNLS